VLQAEEGREGREGGKWQRRWEGGSAPVLRCLRPRAGLEGGGEELVRGRGHPLLPAGAPTPAPPPRPRPLRPSRHSPPRRGWACFLRAMLRPQLALLAPSRLAPQGCEREGLRDL